VIGNFRGHLLGARKTSADPFITHAAGKTIVKRNHYIDVFLFTAMTWMIWRMSHMDLSREEKDRGRYRAGIGNEGFPNGTLSCALSLKSDDSQSGISK
jgi:hypothetical protein